MTMLLAKLDPEKRLLVHASAGHTPAFVIGPDGEVKSELRRTGMPLGITPAADYSVSRQMLLANGDVLVLLTDGLEETANPEGELFGTGRILEIVRNHSDLSAAKIVQSVFEALEAFSENAEQVDDLTMIVAKVE